MPRLTPFKLTSFVLCVLLSACQNLPQQSTAKLEQSDQQHLDVLEQHLKPYVGQPIEQVQQNLEIESIGLEFEQKPIRNEHTLSFSFSRNMPISVPLAPPIRYMDANGVFMPAQGASTDHTVTTPLQCKVIFPIKAGHVQRFILQGRGC